MRKRRNEKSQLILIGGLVVAVAVISIALTIGGGLFSQNTVDDQSLSVFTSTVDNKLDTSLEVSKNNLDFYNTESIEREAKYPEELCDKLINSTKLQNTISNQISTGQVISDITVEENCGTNKTWLTGQSKAGLLPAVNISEPVNSTRKKACAELHFETGYANPDYRDDFIQELEEEYPQGIPAEPDTSEIVDALENENNIDMNLIKNDGELTQEEYVNECIDIVFDEGRKPVDVVFAIDTTGSMSNNNKMNFTKEGAKAALDDLKNVDKVGLVEYNTGLGNFVCTFPTVFGCFNFEYVGGGAEKKLSGDMEKLDSSWSSALKSEIEDFTPDGGTDISAGLDAAKEVLSSGKRGSSETTKHIVLMTDGKQSPSIDNEELGEPEEYIENNENDYKSTFVHTVALSGSSSINKNVLNKLANENGNYSDIRPKGTAIQSSTPEDAENIFRSIIGEIEDETEIRENATGTTPNPDKRLKSDSVLSSGNLEKIEDARFNITNFTGFGDYIIRFTDTDKGNQEIAWEMKVNNTNMTSSPIKGEPATNVGYKLEFYSDTNSKLNEEIYINHTPTGKNLSQPGEYVWLDLTNKTGPRLETGSSFTTGFKDYSNKTDYMKKAWEEVKKETEPKLGGDGIAISIEERNLRGEVRGTFSLEFKPIGGNFKKLGNITGGLFDSSCKISEDKRLPPKCSQEENNVSAVSTALLKDTKIVVEIKSPSGIATKEIQVPKKGRYNYNILESATSP